MNILLRTEIENCLQNKIGFDIKINSFEKVSGGCINNGGKISTTKGNFFIKWNSLPLFENEAKGLKLLKKTNTILVPEVIGFGNTTTENFLILEWLEPVEKSKNYWQDAGSKLAELHKNTQQNFGLDYNNFIGSLPQSNKLHTNWPQFFMQERILFQLEIAQNKYGKLPQNLLNSIGKLPKFLENEFPAIKPSLLHGVLWGGNLINGTGGKPYFIDPAVYYGHHEMDLAFTHLFGSFPAGFYAAYFERFPMQPGFKNRLNFYNLYPLFVHFNLFGGSYLQQIQKILSVL